MYEMHLCAAQWGLTSNEAAMVSSLVLASRLE